MASPSSQFILTEEIKTTLTNSAPTVGGVGARTARCDAKHALSCFDDLVYWTRLEGKL